MNAITYYHIVIDGLQVGEVFRASLRIPSTEEVEVADGNGGGYELCVCSRPDDVVSLSLSYDDFDEPIQQIVRLDFNLQQTKLLVAALRATLRLHRIDEEVQT